MFERFCVNPVTVYAVSTTPGAPGDDIRAKGTGTPYMASVQQGLATMADQLAGSQAIQAGKAAGTVFFSVPPVDTASTPPRTIGLRQDLIEWTDGGVVRTLVVLGPVRNEGGGGVAWSVDYTEIVN